VLTDKRRHSNILDVRSFRGADCDTDHYLVLAKLRERISVSKRARQNRTKPLEVCTETNESKEGYQPRINIIKNENGNLLADPQSVLNRWKIFFNQLLNLHGVHEIGVNFLNSPVTISFSRLTLLPCSWFV
jgi:hypothetical protein